MCICDLSTKGICPLKILHAPTTCSLNQPLVSDTVTHPSYISAPPEHASGHAYIQTCHSAGQGHSSNLPAPLTLSRHQSLKNHKPAPCSDAAPASSNSTSACPDCSDPCLSRLAHDISGPHLILPYKVAQHTGDHHSPVHNLQPHQPPRGSPDLPPLYCRPLRPPRALPPVRESPCGCSLTVSHHPPGIRTKVCQAVDDLQARVDGCEPGVRYGGSCVSSRTARCVDAWHGWFGWGGGGRSGRWLLWCRATGRLYARVGLHCSCTRLELGGAAVGSRVCVWLRRSRSVGRPLRVCVCVQA